MLFNSLPYLIFLPLVVLVYYRLRQRGRQWFVLLASYFFYSFWAFTRPGPWQTKALNLATTDGLLVLTTLVDFSVARWLDREENPGRRRWICAISMACNLAILAVFKYANFLRDSIAGWFGVEPWPHLDVVLPPGISFYTFMSMAYVIDVYRREMRARDTVLDFAVFVAYFPHLVAGPILRAKELLPQLTTLQALDWANIRRGVALILWGMMLKVFIADPMAHVVNEVYSAPAQASGVGLLMATYAFAVQIYCDFAGYSDIAIGSALLLGVKLPENFRTPYLSLSIREFWRRWHISLSSWLRDYLYIPLGGSRKGTGHTYLNLMLTMLLGGLWHGAGWHWMVWGGIQGVAMVVERLAGLKEEHPASLALRVVRWFVTYHIVLLSWVFFRSAGISEAAATLQRIVTLAPGEYYGGVTPVLMVLLVLALDLSGLRARWVGAMDERPRTLRWIAYGAVVLLAVTFQGASNPEFIYFAF